MNDHIEKNAETPQGAASELSAGLERRVTELAEWFSDNPNTNDIADALRVLVRDVAFAEREACAKESELLLRLVSAVTASEFGGISCFDIDGHGNWFDVRDALLCSNVELSGGGAFPPSA